MGRLLVLTSALALVKVLALAGESITVVRSTSKLLLGTEDGISRQDGLDEYIFFD